MPKKNVLVVDDNTGVRTLIRSFVEREGYRVCGEAGNGTEAIEAALRLNPDLILLDYAMPEMNGAEAASVLKHRLPSVRIILFTLHADDVGPAMKKVLDIDAVIGKADGMDSLINSMRTLLGGASASSQLA